MDTTFILYMPQSVVAIQAGCHINKK